MPVTAFSSPTIPVVPYGNAALIVEIAFDADPTASYKDCVLGTLPYAYWRLDESSGNVVDSSGNGNSGTATSLTYSETGPLQGDSTSTGILFNGTTSQIQVGSSTSIDLPASTTTFSAEFWMKLTALPGANAYIFSKASAYTLNITTTGALKLAFNAASATSIAGVVAGDSAWHHYVVSWDNTKAYYFVDGVMKDSQALVNGAITVNTNALYIGSSGGGNYFSGYLKDLALNTNCIANDPAAVPPTPGADIVNYHYQARYTNINPTWTDVSSYVMSCQTQRGRQFELDRVQAGTATLILDNSGGEFDPKNTASPFNNGTDANEGVVGNNQIKALRPIRIQIAYSGQSGYWLFKGYVERWPENWEGTSWATTQITAVDGFQLLSTAYPNTSLIASATSDVQVGQFLDASQWPIANRNIDTNQTIELIDQISNVSGLQSALTYLNYIADSENGNFYMSADGKATFEAKLFRYNSTYSVNSQTTFGDLDDENEYRALVPSFDNQRIINDCVLTYGNPSATSRASTYSSMRRYGRNTLRRTTYIKNQVDADDLSGFIAVNFAEPTVRYDSMVIEPASNDTIWKDVLATHNGDGTIAAVRELGHRITVNRRPPGVRYVNLIESLSPNLYWRMNEISGTTAVDSSGNGHSGTYGTGITLNQTGNIISDLSTAASFDGSTSAVITSSYAPFVVGSQRTFMGWANRTDSSIWNFIINDPLENTSLALIASSEDVTFRPSAGGSVTWSAAWPGTAQWVHWALTYNDTTKAAELFINGVSKGVQTCGAGWVTPGNFGVSATGNAWKGEMQDVAVFESILTSSQIANAAAGPAVSTDVYIEAIGWNITPDALWQVTWQLSPVPSSSAFKLDISTMDGPDVLV